MKHTIYKIILISLGIISFHVSDAQDESLTDFGIHLTPMSTLSTPKDGASLQFEGAWGYELGGDYYSDLSSRFQMKFSLNYSHTKVIFNDYSLFFSCDFNILSGGDNTLYNSWMSDVNEIHALGIGTEVRFKLVGEENHLYVKLGFNGNFNVDSDQHSELVECGLAPREVMSNPRTELKNLYSELKTGIGYEMIIGNKMKAFLEPEFRYALNNPIGLIDLISENIQNPKFIKLGLNMGFRF